MTTNGSQHPAADAPVDEQRARERREREFWDTAYNDTQLDLPGWMNTNPWAVHRQTLLGDVRDKRMLDLGCGSGMWSVQFARQGAQVDAIDISTSGIATMHARARHYDVASRVTGAVGSAHELPYADASFDLVHGEAILHHVDVSLAGPEIKRVLRPGGRAVFLENSANNPLLMAARKLCGHFGISKWSTDDEYPLMRWQIDVLAKAIGPCEVIFPAFLGFALLDDKLFGGRNITRPLDRFIYRYLPFARQYSYSQLLRFERESD